MKSFKTFLKENKDLRITKAVYDELSYYEVDTFDGGNKEKAKFVKAIEKAKKKGAAYVINVDEYMKTWLLKALDNMIDIKDDQGEKAMLNKLRKLETKVKNEY